MHVTVTNPGSVRPSRPVSTRRLTVRDLRC